MVAALSPRAVTSALRLESRCAGARPASTVVLSVASSQTVQVDSSAPSGVAMTSGAPGMPTSDPRLTRSIADVLTSAGSSATPVINRADARFSAGCMVSPMRTYNAPDSRATTIAALPTSPRGCRNARTAHTATAMAARTHPAASESDCARSGSSTMRTSPRTSAFSIRRTRKRYPLTCSLVVDCPAIPSPAVSLTAGRGWSRSPIVDAPSLLLGLSRRWRQSALARRSR